MGRCPTPCASPTPSNSAGTTFPEALLSRPCGSGSAWTATRRSSWSPLLAGTAGCRPDPWRPPFPVAALPLARPLAVRELAAVSLAAGRARRRDPSMCATPRRSCRHRRGRQLVVTVHDLAFLRAPRLVHPPRRSSDAPQPRAHRAACRHRGVPEPGDDGRRRGRRCRNGSAPSRTARRRRDRGRRRTRSTGCGPVTTSRRASCCSWAPSSRARTSRVLALAVARLDEPLPLVIAGADGWGGVADTVGAASVDARFLGFVADGELAGLYAARLGVRLPECLGGVRVARCRGDGAGHAGRHESGDVDCRGRRRGRGARRPTRCRRHRPWSHGGARRSRPVARRRPRPSGRADVGGGRPRPRVPSTPRFGDECRHRRQPVVVQAGRGRWIGGVPRSPACRSRPARQRRRGSRCAARRRSPVRIRS